MRQTILVALAAVTVGACAVKPVTDVAPKHTATFPGDYRSLSACVFPKVHATSRSGFLITSGRHYTMYRDEPRETAYIVQEPANAHYTFRQITPDKVLVEYRVRPGLLDGSEPPLKWSWVEHCANGRAAQAR